MKGHTHTPRKRFGQNFLTDTHIIDKIVLAIAPGKNDNIVEIGPGLGALTTKLLPLLEKLSVVEIDRDLATHLTTLQKNHPELTIHNADALKFDFGALASAGKLRVIGNLPYNISTPLLFHLFAYNPLILDMHFMLQKEVVDRMTAQPGSNDFGRLSVMVQYYSDCQKLFNVKPGSFNPAPKVDSAVTRLQIRPPALPAKSETHFSQLVKQAFSQRRKQLKNNLKKMTEPSVITSCNIDPGTRAETLSVDDFVRLSNAIYDQAQC